MPRIRLLALLFACASLSACADSDVSPGAGDAPAWTHQQARTVDSGYIVYVGSGEDRSAERARFKAESMAIQDLANECSFAPKGARVEDGYDQPIEGGLFRSYAKLGVQYEDCEAAKNANDPTQIKRLANDSMTQQLKRYQDMLGNPDDDLTEQAVAQQPGAQGGDIQGTSQFYAVRQYVVLQKQTVILAPPGSYLPGSPESVTFVRSVRPWTERVHAYELANPGLRAAPTTWTQVRRREFAGRAFRQRPFAGRRQAARQDLRRRRRRRR